MDLFEEPVGDEHVSGGRCKGVNGVIFQHGKMIRNVGTIGGQSHRLADEIYIPHELRLLQSTAESGDNLQGDGLSEGLFLLVSDWHKAAGEGAEATEDVAETRASRFFVRG